RGTAAEIASATPATARMPRSAPRRGGSFAPCSRTSAAEPAATSRPASISSSLSRRAAGGACGCTKSTKNAVPNPSAMPAYESARPATSSGEGGGAAALPTSGSAGRGALPTAKAKAPFVVWPSTADDAVHDTRYPPSPIGCSETLSPFGSPDGARSFLSTRLPATSAPVGTLVGYWRAVVDSTSLNRPGPDSNLSFTSVSSTLPLNVKAYAPSFVGTKYAA